MRTFTGIQALRGASLPSPAFAMFMLLSIAAGFSLVFIATYPINIAASGDGPNYLRMLMLGESNLIHASGGPFIVGSVLHLLGIEAPVYEIFSFRSLFEGSPTYLFAVLLAQHAIHFAILTASFLWCARSFGVFAAGVLLLVWATNLASLGNVSSVAPEWLMGDLICLVVVLCAVAYVSDRKAIKAGAYLSAAFLLAWAYLVKYNAAPFVIVLAAAILTEAASWRWRLIVAGGSLAIAASVVALYIQFFHFPSAGTTDLNYDHAWVLVLRAGHGMTPPGLNAANGINTQRWIALSVVLPPNYGVAGAYRHVADIGPHEIVEQFRPSYDEIMRMSRADLQEFIDRNPLPPTFDVNVSAIPLYYYVGLKKTDHLGIAVFWEFVAADPVSYIKEVLVNTFSVTPASRMFAILPLPFQMWGLEEGSILANSFLELKGDYNVNYWSPNLIVWRPGVQFFGWIATHVRPSMIELIALIAGFGGIVCSSSARDRRLIAIIVGGWFAFSVFSNLVGLVRFKEGIAIWPYTSFMLAIGLAQVASCLYRRARQRRSKPDDPAIIAT